jgi:hypothetical protein
MGFAEGYLIAQKIKTQREELEREKKIADYRIKLLDMQTQEAQHKLKQAVDQQAGLQQFVSTLRPPAAERQPFPGGSQVAPVGPTGPVSLGESGYAPQMAGEERLRTARARELDTAIQAMGRAVQKPSDVEGALKLLQIRFPEAGADWMERQLLATLQQDAGATPAASWEQGATFPVPGAQASTGSGATALPEQQMPSRTMPAPAGPGTSVSTGPTAAPALPPGMPPALAEQYGLGQQALSGAPVALQGDLGKLRLWQTRVEELRRQRQRYAPFALRESGKRYLAELDSQIKDAEAQITRLEGGTNDRDAVAGELFGQSFTTLKPPQKAAVNQVVQQREERKMAVQGSVGARYAAEKAYQGEMGRQRAERETRENLTAQEVLKDDVERFYDVTTGQQIRPTITYKALEGAQTQGQVKRLTKAQQEKVEVISEAVPIIARVQSYVDQIYGPNGILAHLSPSDRQLLGSKAGVEQLIQRYPVLTAANRYLQANAELLARALKGVRGGATEGDVQRALAMLPQLTASLDVKLWPPKVDLTLPDTRGTALRVMDDLVDSLNKVSGTVLGNPDFAHPTLHRYGRPEEGLPGQQGQPGRPSATVTEGRLPAGSGASGPLPSPSTRAGAQIDPVKERASAALRDLKPAQINALTDEDLEALGIQTIDDAPYTSVGVRNALRLRLARRRHQAQPPTSAYPRAVGQ